MTTIILPFLGAVVILYLVGVWITLYHLLKFRLPHTPAMARHNPHDTSMIIASVTIAGSCILLIALGYFVATTPWSLVQEILEDVVRSAIPR